MEEPEMTPEKQQIAIAEFEGWKKIRAVDCGRPLGIPPNDLTSRPLPDYLNDLNAMHEVEEKLNNYHAIEFRRILNDVISREPANCFAANFSYHATAAQRAEAFLRTIDKWEE